MKRVGFVFLTFLCLVALAMFAGCTSSSGGGGGGGADDDNGADDDATDDDATDDDTTDDDTVDDDADVCGDPLLDQYATHCSWYDNPCKATPDEFSIDDGKLTYGQTGFLKGEYEGTQFILDTPFHVQKIKLYFQKPGGQATIHIYADLLGSEPTLQPLNPAVTPVEYMDPITIDVPSEGWVEVDVSDKGLIFMPSTKFWVIYEHLTDDGLPTLGMSHTANGPEIIRSRYYQQKWAQDNAPFEWGYASYVYMIHLEGNSFCVWDNPTYFKDVTAAAGVNVVGQHRTAWTDVDGDGQLDLVLTKLADATVGNRIVYYHNNGDGTFTDATAGSGLDGEYYSQVTLMADYDNNGTEDAIIIAPVPYPADKQHARSRADDDTADDDTADDDTTPENFSLILLNDGAGHFTPKTDSGLAVYGNLSGASLGDYDRDGWLDLYVGAWLKVYPYSPCDPDYLFHNNQDGTFSDVSEASGIRNVTPSACYGVIWVDYNNDGWYDIFVSNYGRMFNFLFKNNHDGTFTNVASDVHLDAALHDKPGNGFGVDFGDVNGDGYLDAILSDIAHPRYQPDSGPSSFNFNGGPDQNYAFSWANDQMNFVPNEGDVDPSFIDYNNDGRLDLFMCTLYPGSFARLYEQQEDGTFLDVSYWSGLNVPTCTDAAWADYDGDGKLDLVWTSNRGGSDGSGGAWVYHNETPSDFNWTEIRLVGVTSNHDAIGAKVIVTAGDLVQVRYVQGPRGHYGATPQLRQHFGLRLEGAIDQIEVQWPNGQSETWSAAEINKFITLTEGDPSIQYQ